MDERAVVSNWRDWLPAGAVAAACVGIISVTLTGVPRSESVSPSFIASSPANFDRVPRNFGSIPLGLHRVDLSRNERRPAPIDDDPPSF
jgi:hypothetical protein